MTTITSRRSILAGAAAVPALSLPAFAAVDPIFAAIEKHRLADARYVKSFEPHEAAVDRGEIAEFEEITARPTTAAGCAAILRHVEQYEATLHPEGLFSDWRDDIASAGRNLLSRIATALESRA